LAASDVRSCEQSDFGEDVQGDAQRDGNGQSPAESRGDQLFGGCDDIGVRESTKETDRAQIEGRAGHHFFEPPPARSELRELDRLPPPELRRLPDDDQLRNERRRELEPPNQSSSSPA
jgi:hypothetical protein